MPLVLHLSEYQLPEVMPVLDVVVVVVVLLDELLELLLEDDAALVLLVHAPWAVNRDATAGGSQAACDVFA
jgi:hypothetical protein